MVKNTTLQFAGAALLATSFATPAMSFPNFQLRAPTGAVACSDVASPRSFKRIAPKDSPTVAVKVCYLTSAEAFWPSRYNIVGGYLYLVRGVAYRVKALSESECSDQPSRKRGKRNKYISSVSAEFQSAFPEVELLTTGGGYKKKKKYRSRGCNEERRGRGREGREM